MARRVANTPFRAGMRNPVLCSNCPERRETTYVEQSATILGISAYYHDAAAALLRDGEIVAAAQEERFTRKKHDASFPRQAAAYCPEEAATLADVDQVVFYDKPLIVRASPGNVPGVCAQRLSLISGRHAGLAEGEALLKSTLRSELADLGGMKSTELPPLMFAEHHQSHAASAFFFSPSNVPPCLHGRRRGDHLGLAR